MTDKLSSPLEFTENIDQCLQIAYDYFSINIGNKSNRPALFDKEIFVDCTEYIDNRPVGFWHLVSFDEKHHFPKLLPCTNDPCIDICAQNCNLHKLQIAVHGGYTRRNLCIYRASRLPWIIDIIKLANRDDPSVKTWIKPRMGSNPQKLYLRYQKYGNDYLIVFNVQKHFYRIISAFPVFYLQDKTLYDKEYSAHKWSYFGH